MESSRLLTNYKCPTIIDWFVVQFFVILPNQNLQCSLRFGGMISNQRKISTFAQIMIINGAVCAYLSNTPRVSLFGGGTDFPEFYHEHGGAVLGFSIDKFIYHTFQKMPPGLHKHRLKVCYSKIEEVQSVDEIQHTPIREMLKLYDLTSDLELHIISDVPSSTGLGSSSSFVVGLLHALKILKGFPIDRVALAEEAISVERSLLSEKVGCQDQTFASFGGFNLLKWNTDGRTKITPLNLSYEQISVLESHLLLVYTGVTRRADSIEKKKFSDMSAITESLLEMRSLVDDAFELICKCQNFNELGSLLSESWKLKRSLSPSVSNSLIDKYFKAGIKAGAFGGKLLGAGGGWLSTVYSSPRTKRKSEEFT